MKRHLALEAIIGPTVAGLGYEFVGLEYFAQGKHSILRVYIDKPPGGVNAGVGIEDCEKVSNMLESVLDVEAELVRGTYTLEVSSPGVDRKIFSVEQFPRFVGQQIALTLHTPLNGQRNFVGILNAVNEDHISLEIKGIVTNIDFANIAHANVNQANVKV